MNYLPIFISALSFAFLFTPFSRVSAMSIPQTFHLDGLTFSQPLQIENPANIPIQKVPIRFGLSAKLWMTKNTVKTSPSTISYLPNPTPFSPDPISLQVSPSPETRPEITVAPTPSLAPTNLPTPTPQAIATPSDLDSIFSKFSDEFHVDREVLKRIAKCESSFNPQARNGIYGGMFQFGESSWTAVRNRMGLDVNPELRFNSEEAIRTAAYHIANGGQGAWPSC